MSELSPFAKRVKAHVEWHFRNRQSSFVGVYASPENVQLVFNGIIQLVAEAEHWPEPINYNYATFQVANQTLYLRCGIMVDVLQRPHAHPDKGEMKWVEEEVEKYTKIFFDLTTSPSNEAQDNY